MKSNYSIDYDEFGPLNQAVVGYEVGALLRSGQQKWGWIFYRTSYSSASEELWPQAKDRIMQQMLDAYSEDSAMLDMMDHKFISDPEKLDAIDTVALRNIHVAYRDSDEAKEWHKNFRGVSLEEVSRYRYYLALDEKAMRSIVHPPGKASGHIFGDRQGSYVKIVVCDGWYYGDELESEPWCAADEGEYNWEDDRWALVGLQYIIFEAYSNLAGTEDDPWYRLKGEHWARHYFPHAFE